MKPNGKVSLSLLGALKRYWPCVILVAATPALCVLTGEYVQFPGSVGVVFFASLIAGIVLPYRLGKAPYSYVIACCLIFFFVGAAIAYGTIHIVGIDGHPGPTPNAPPR